MSKFKVGDNVRVLRNTSLEKRKDAYIGKEFTIKNLQGESMFSNGTRYGIGEPYVVYENEIELATPRHEIHITCTDGRTTHAVKKVDGKIVARSKAVCCPTDEFDFAVGANLAYDRLMRPEKCATETAPTEPTEDKPEPIKLYCVEDYQGICCSITKGNIYELDSDGCIHYNEGKGARFASLERWRKGNPGYAAHLVPLVSRPAKLGETVRFIQPHGGDLMVGTLHKATSIHGDTVMFECGCVCSVPEKYEVLDGYTPEPEKPKEPEYYSGRVVCVAGSSGFTVGKPYEFKNGVVVDDDGDLRPNNGYQKITSLSDTYLRDWENKFIPFLGE